MKGRKCFFQLVDRETGMRSAAVGATVGDFAKSLRTNLSVDGDKQYVLLLVDDCDAEEWKFSLAPMMTVTSFLKMVELSGD